MLKLKYYSLNKEERYLLKEEFYKTEFGKSIKKRLDRLFITGSLGIIFSIYLFITPKTKWDLVTGIILFITSVFFTTQSHKIRIKKINSFLTQKKKK